MSQPTFSDYTTYDGKKVAPDSAEWKIECLCRYILALPTRGHMEQWIVEFGQKHKDRPDIEAGLRAYLNDMRKADQSRHKVTENVTPPAEE